MRKLIQASLLALALTASVYAGDIGQPCTAACDAVTAQGDMATGLTDIALSILGSTLSLI
jgi:hypothetical protein